jgi:polysaccharide export outer membrane protein
MTMRYSLLYLLLLVIGLLGSCAASKKAYRDIPYFKDLPDSAMATIQNARYKQLTIQPDDILSITIQTLDPTANSIFSQGVSSSLQGSGASPSMPVGMGGSAAAAAPTGYLVDKDGQIELPLLGTFHLAGMTTLQARDTIQQAAAHYYKQPAVYVRFSNFKVTILGEVSRPGTYTLPNERNTLFDALGLAGDLTIFGKRTNVLMIRDSAGYSRMIRFSLNSKDLVRQDYFFLRQNDVLYVEPNKSKMASQDAIQARNYAIIASVLTLLIVIATRIN